MAYSNSDPFRSNIPFIRKPVNKPKPRQPDPVRRILPVNPIVPTVPKPNLPKMK